MDQYAVVGNPISHSKSPEIQNSFAAQQAQDMNYDKIEVPLDGFAAFISEHFASPENKGLNVTVPFKEEAWALCNERTERAELAGAVNTLYLNQNGDLTGDNTDGVGLVRDLTVNHHVEITGRRVLILGAGGAVRGVLQPVLNENPEALVIANRTESKAQSLAEHFKAYGNVSSASFEALGEGFDVIINGTSASLSGDLPSISASVFSANTAVYDMMYAKEKTVFNAWAERSGAGQTIDGLGMLVEQAAEAFYIWRGVRPDTAQIRAKLRT